MDPISNSSSSSSSDKTVRKHPPRKCPQFPHDSFENLFVPARDTDPDLREQAIKTTTRKLAIKPTLRKHKISPVHPIRPIRSKPMPSKRACDCLVCEKDIRILTKARSGPDGPNTLCNSCYKQYANMTLPVYRSPDVCGTFRISVVPSSDATEMKIVAFSVKKNGRRDLSKPTVVPVDTVTAQKGVRAISSPLGVGGKDVWGAGMVGRDDFSEEEEYIGEASGDDAKGHAFSVKITFENEPIRRFKIHDGLSFNGFKDKVQAKFQLSSPFKMMYIDHENDTVMLNSEEEFEELFDILRCSVNHSDTSFKPFTCLYPLRIQICSEYY